MTDHERIVFDVEERLLVTNETENMRRAVGMAQSLLLSWRSRLPYDQDSELRSASYETEKYKDLVIVSNTPTEADVTCTTDGVPMRYQFNALAATPLQVELQEGRPSVDHSDLGWLTRFSRILFDSDKHEKRS